MKKDYDFLTSAKALAPTETIDLPELDLKVQVRGLTAREINQANKAATKILIKGKKGKPDEVEVDGEKLTAALLARSLFTLDGKRLIPEGREDEVFDLPHDLVAKLTKTVFSINGMKAPEEEPEGNS